MVKKRTRQTKKTNEIKDKTMTYQEVQAKARQLRENGLLAKKFSLKQKKSILLEAIATVENKQSETATEKGPIATRRDIYETLEQQATKNKKMTQEVFNHEFIQVYANEQLRQEREGVVAMRLEELRELFQQKHKITNKTFYRYIKKLPHSFPVWENGKQLLQVLFTRQQDGTYKIAV